jgi:hypothetical protein
VDPNQHIADLLAEARAACGPAAWPRVAELIEGLVGLYGDGLRRLMAQLDYTAQRRLAGDELVASLLCLHGLHPLTIEERLRAALAQIADRVGRVDLSQVKDGVAHFTLEAGAPAQLLRPLLERLAQEAAPELRAISLEEPLLQIDLSRSRFAP